MQDSGISQLSLLSFQHRAKLGYAMYLVSTVGFYGRRSHAIRCCVPIHTNDMRLRYCGSKIYHGQEVDNI